MDPVIGFDVGKGENQVQAFYEHDRLRNFY